MATIRVSTQLPTIVKLAHKINKPLCRCPPRTISDQKVTQTVILALKEAQNGGDDNAEKTNFSKEARTTPKLGSFSGPAEPVLNDYHCPLG